MIQKDVLNCWKCGREIHIPVHVESDVKSGVKILCARCATDATKGNQFPSEAK